MRDRRSRALKTAVVAVSLWASPGLAQDAQPEPGADELEYFLDVEQQLLEGVELTTSTKSTRTIEETPSMVTVFRREDFTRLGARRLIDLLAHVPGFFEVASQLERNIAIRGIHAAAPQHFVVLVDGLTMNDFLFGSTMVDSFSLEYAERVEIIRGPGSAVYGANALMGVVNIITRKVADGQKGRVALEAGTQGLARVDGHFSSALGDTRSVLGAISLHRQGGTVRSGDPTEDVLVPGLGQNISDGIQPGENLTQPLANNRTFVNEQGLSFDLFTKYQDESFAVRFSGARNDFFLQRNYVQSLTSQAAYAERPRYVTERWMLDVEKRWGSMDAWGAITLRPSVALFDHQMSSSRISPEFFDRAERELQSLTYSWRGRGLRLAPALDYSLKLPDFGGLTQNEVLVGTQADYSVAYDYSMTRCYVDSDKKFDPAPNASQSGPDMYCNDQLMLREGLVVDAYGGIKESGKPLFGDGDELRWGMFLQASTVLPANIGVLGGARIDYNWTEAPQFSPRIAVVAPLGKRFYVKAQYSSAFVYSAFLYRTGNALSDYIGNVAIDPQSIQVYEAMGGFKNESVRLELSGYLNHVSKFITFDLSRNAKTGRYMFSNQGDVRVAGAEFTGLWRTWGGRFGLDFHATFVKPLPGTSEAFVVDGKLGGPTKFPELATRLAASVTPVRSLEVSVNALYNTPIAHTIAKEVRFEDIEGTDGSTYSSKTAAQYNTAALMVGAHVTWRPVERWSAELSVSNLLDQRVYRPGSVLIPHLVEGRRVSAAVAYEF